MPKVAPLLVALSLAATAALAGCAAEPPASSRPDATRSLEPTAAQPPADDDAPLVVQHGQPLSAAEAKKLNGQMGTLRPYQAADGSYLALDVKQPLPEAVKQEVAAQIATTDTSDLGSFFAEMDRQSARTGKTLIVVRYFRASDPYGNYSTAWRSASFAPKFPGGSGATAEQVAADARAWADMQRDPGQLDVVIVNG